MYNLIITALLVGAFFCIISAYWWGYKHGRQVVNGIIPKVNINPIAHVVEAIEDHVIKKKQEEVKKDMDDIMNYSAETALEAIKEEAKKKRGE